MTKISSRGFRAAILSTTALAGLIAVPGIAQAQAPVTAAAPATEIATGEEIIVLGTRRTDRTLTNSASPVDVIGAKELLTQPASNLLDVVKNVVPSLYVPSNAISDASTFVHSPSLRGLPADNVLVMINGKRLNRSALVQVYSGGDTGLGYGSQGADVGSIPAIALSNLQVLRDGATAQYGSDAIAGVMNYGIRRDKGIELQGRYGQYYDHGDGRSYQLSGDAGFSLGGRGFINVAGEYFDDGRTSRGVQPVRALGYLAQNPGNEKLLPFYPFPAQVWGNSPTRGWKVLVNSELELSNTAKFYFVGNAARSRAEESFNYRPSTTTYLDSTGSTVHASRQPGDIVLCARNFLNYNPVAGPDANGCDTTQDPYFRNLYPAGFTPLFIGTVTQLWGVAGIKGTAGALNVRRVGLIQSQYTRPGNEEFAERRVQPQ